MLEDPLLTPQETADYLRVSVNKLAQWRCLGKGPHFVKLERLVRYREGDIIDYLDARICQIAAQERKIEGIIARKYIAYYYDNQNQKRDTFEFEGKSLANAKTIAFKHSKECDTKISLWTVSPKKEIASREALHAGGFITGMRRWINK